MHSSSVRASLVTLTLLMGCGSASELPLSFTRSSGRGTGGTSPSGGTGGAGATPGSGGFGAVSTGGSIASGGAIGVGGAPPTGCTSLTSLVDWESLIADFECLQGSTDVGWLPVNGWPHGSYNYYNDTPNTGIVWASDPVFEGGYVSPGHASIGAIYLKLTKPSENWGAGQGIWIGDGQAGCLDASVFEGVRFWAKGQSVEGTASVSIGTFATNPPPNGSCELGDACLSYAVSIALTNSWTEYEVRWGDLVAPAAGIAPFDPTKLAGSINFHVDTWYEAETLEMWLDDVEFIGPVSDIPRNCGP
jgi:hypothetical protein